MERPKIVMPDGTELYCVRKEEMEKIDQYNALREMCVAAQTELRTAQLQLLAIRDLVCPKDDPVEEPPGEPVFDGDTIVVAPSDNIQSAIDRAEEGDTVVLQAGRYIGTMNLSGKENIRITGQVDADGEKVTFIDNMVDVDLQWQFYEEEGVYAARYPGFNGLWHWRGDHAEDTFNNRLMYPLMCGIELGPSHYKPLIYNPDGADFLSKGEFSVTSAPNVPGVITVKLVDEDKIENFRLCPYPRIIWGNEECSGIHIENLEVIGCSNTGKTGAVNFPGDQWHVNNVTVTLARTIGIELGQGGDKSDMRSKVKDSVFKNVYAIDSGQMGWWGSAFDCELIDCGHQGSNLFEFDHWWEASHKFENMHHCKIVRWTALQCKGPGFWFDGVNGGNMENELISPNISYCERAGIELELSTSRNIITDPNISNINKSAYNEDKPWMLSSGITIKAGSNLNMVEGGVIMKCEEAIRIDNSERGISDNNTISSMSWVDIEKDPPVTLLGEKLNNKW